MFSKFICHKNGHRYYPFHVDLYGISYIDVDTLEVFNYVPQGQDNDYDAACGESFIITSIDYDAATNLIAYGGCYWAASSDVMIGDFSTPLHFNPKLVSVHQLIDPKYEKHDDIDFISWENGTLLVKGDGSNEKITISALVLQEKIRQGF